jgi:hypothetical protein
VSYSRSQAQTFNCVCDQGKDVIWGDAQSKTADASEQARLAEVNACAAQKHLSSVDSAKRDADSARARLAEVGHTIAVPSDYLLEVRQVHRQPHTCFLIFCAKKCAGSFSSDLVEFRRVKP